MKVKCYVCNKEIDDTDNYCRHCGARTEISRSAGGFVMDMKLPTVDVSHLYVKPAVYSKPAATSEPVPADRNIHEEIEEASADTIVLTAPTANRSNLRPSAKEISIQEKPAPVSEIPAASPPPSPEPPPAPCLEDGEAPADENESPWYGSLPNLGKEFVSNIWEMLKLNSERWTDKIEGREHNEVHYNDWKKSIHLKKSAIDLYEEIKEVSKKIFTILTGNDD